MNIKQRVLDAFNNSYAIPACNFENFDLLEGIIIGAKKAKSPIFVQTTEPTVKRLGIDRIVYITKSLSNQYEVPVILHLDHGQDLDLIEKCIEEGYSSVMVDCSKMNIQDNITIIQNIRSKIGEREILLEAEVGVVGSQLEKGILTSTNDVNTLVHNVDIDLLAVSVGNIHGEKERIHHLDFDLLSNIRNIANKPLVIHGSSGIDNKDIKLSIGYGVIKVNVETELRRLFRKTVEEFYKHKPYDIKIRNLSENIKKSISNYVWEKCVLYNSVNTI